MHLRELFSCCYLITSWSFLCLQKMIYFCHLKRIKSLKSSRSPACLYVPTCPTGQLDRFEELSSDSNSVIDNSDFKKKTNLYHYLSPCFLIAKEGSGNLVGFHFVVF